MDLFHINSIILFQLLHLSIFLVFQFFLINCKDLGQCLQTESSALLQLKRGFTSGDLDTWKLGTNCCIWEGVTCDESSGRVIGLDMSNRFITGTIDPSLFNLTSLRTLNFANNQFHGISIPKYGWDCLANLSILYLSNAGFVGKIPADIFLLTKLTFLDLSSLYGEFGGLSLTSKPIFLQKKSSLIELHLDYVDLSSYENDWCGSLANFAPLLEVLSMSNCFLTRASCSSLSMLTGLYSLDLTENNLDSSIFYSFVNFTFLSELSAPRNNFNGVFPRQIFLLKNLENLDVSHNQMLFGSLPKFPEDSNLMFLTLFGTSFSGDLPDTIGNLKYLTHLDLAYCQFSGRIPPSIGDLSQLEFLDLSNNNLEGKIPKSIFQILGLYFLSLGSNNLSGDLELEFIIDLKNLYYLDLSNSGLSLNAWVAYNGSVLSSFPKISYLMVVGCNLTNIPIIINYPHAMNVCDLSNNRIHGEIPSWFWRILVLNISCNMFTHFEEPPLNPTMYNYLSIIDLHSNMLEGPIPPLPLTNIYFLDLSNNQFTYFISFNLTTKENSMTYLSLANNSLTGEIPTFICNLTNLQMLDLSNNRLSSSIPPCLFNDGNDLQVLNLRGNQLRGAIPDGISSKCNLEIINLRSNQLEEMLPRSLSNCQSLEILDMANNNLKDTFPHWLGNMPSLKVLILRGNKFNGLICPPDGNHERNYSFSMMHVLDISSNSFNGKLCSEYFSNFKSMMINGGDTIQNYTSGYFDQYYNLDVLIITDKGQLMEITKFWKIVKSIDFSNNLFEGEIPITIGQLSYIQVLNLSHNNLTGKIIPQLGNLSQLESLDLSMNSLSGRIPQELVSLHFLEYLNLSYNKLVGNIPVGGQFFSFSNSSFEGNNGLCMLTCNTTVPRVNNTTTSSSLGNRAPKYRRYMIILGILFGIGFGGSMTVVVVLDVMYCDRRWRRSSMRPIDR